MLVALRLHPDSTCLAVTSIEVEVTRSRDGLTLRYVVSGAVGGLRLPPVTAPERADELWRYTCFEAFIRPSPATSYYEFNFAPSTQWVAYRFDSYRSGMHAAGGLGAPRIDVQSGATAFTLRASLALDGVPELSQHAVWRLGLSAVIEEIDGQRSYWALAHPPGHADFHHSDCFAHEVSAA